MEIQPEANEPVGADTVPDRRGDYIGYPFPFLILGEQYLLALVGAPVVVLGVWSLARTTCSQCVNFSCPMNRVPQPVIDAFLDRNPVMRQAERTPLPPGDTPQG